MVAPTVSVICPVSNRGQPLRDTVESVRHQSRSDWELLLISDASTDESDDIAADYAAADPRIRFFRLPKQGHPGPLRNFGLRVAAGSFIAYLDHDDAYLPHHLETMVAAADRGWVVSGAIYVDDRGQVVRIMDEHDLLWSRELQICAPIFEPSRFLCSRPVAERVGQWASGDHGLEDWDMWERLSALSVRPRLLAEPGVQIFEGPDTRRSRLRTEYVQPIAEMATIDAASARIAAIYADLRQPVTDAYTADVLEWIGAEARSGELEQPGGRSAADLDNGWEIEPDFIGQRSLLALDLGDRAAVGFALPCLRAEHARLADEVFRRRHPRLLRLLST